MLFNNKFIHLCTLVIPLLAFNHKTANAETFLNLPDPIANAALYGDFYSYSLPILASNYDLIYGGGVGPGNPYYVDSGPGQIADDIVIATGSNGKPVNQNFDGMNWAYETPNSSGIKYRATSETAFHPNNDGLTAAQDNETTWNSTIAALDTYLGADNIFPTFLVNNNQVSSGAATNQSLVLWMQVYLWSSTNPGAVDPLVYTLANNCPIGNFCLSGGIVDFTTGGIIAGPDKDPTLYSRDLADNNYPVTDQGAGTTPTYDDFVISGGKVCLDDTIGIPVNCSEPHDRQFAHNLGANQAAYAVYSSELNDALASWRAGGLSEYDMLSVDLRLGCNPDTTEGFDCTGMQLNNGYEQMFLAKSVFDNPPPPSGVPVPPAFLLFASSSLLLAWQGRRKKA